METNSTSILLVPALAGSTAIAVKYARMGAANGTLGKRVGHIQNIVGPGLIQNYQHGSICWSPRTRAIEVDDPIRTFWQDLVAQQRGIGLPITDNVNTPKGRVSQFQVGAICAANTGSVYLIYQSKPSFGLSTLPGETHGGITASTTVNVNEPGVVAIDLDGASVVTPPSDQPLPTSVLDPTANSTICIGIIALFNPNPDGTGGAGRVFNPDDGPSDSEVARGIVGAVLQTLIDAGNPGFVGTAISMF